MNAASIIIPDYKLAKFIEELDNAGFIFTAQPFPALPAAYIITVKFGALKEKHLQTVVQKVSEHFNEGMIKLTDKDAPNYEA